MFAGDTALATAIATEVETLAVHFNGGRFGFLADEDSPGRVLERETAAPYGQATLRGQCGSFTLDLPPRA
ncbi:MAG: hypothetical protein U0Q11_11705 [Vicinamibacterales bacterium]